MGVLGVFMLLRIPGGVVGGSPDSDLVLSDLILAEVGVLRGSRFKGGSRSVCSAFLLALVCCCLGGGNCCIFASGTGTGAAGMRDTGGGTK